MSGERDDYLWDRSGPVDPEVARLERLLGRFGHDGRGLRRRRGPVLVVAAAALLAAGLLWWAPWAGGPGAHELALVERATERRLARAAEFAPTRRTVLDLADIGTITLDAGSLLRVDRIDREQTRLHLARGRLQAVVSAEARPRFFQVDTPSTLCVDLGCRYTLSVDNRGTADVHVELGKVAFESKGREIFVPAGAVCRATRAHGAEIPHFKGTTPGTVVKLLMALHRAPVTDPDRLALVEGILRAISEGGQRRDSLIVWHLLQDGAPDVVARAAAWLAQNREEPSQLSMAGDDPETRREIWKQHLEPEWY